MVPEEFIGADASVQPFLSDMGPEGYMNIQDTVDNEKGILALGWSLADTPEGAEWLNSGGLGGEFPEPDRGNLFSPGLSFGDDDEDDDIDDDEDNFDDMEDDFEDDFEDEDDDFEDEDEEDDDYDDDYDGDFDDDFGE
jgi:hypothetical protein